MFLVPTPTDGATASGVANPFDIAKSWLVTGAGLDIAIVRQIAGALITVVVLGFSLAALSTVGVLVPTGWWQGLVLGSTPVSIILLAAPGGASTSPAG